MMRNVGVEGVGEINPHRCIATSFKSANGGGFQGELEGVTYRWVIIIQADDDPTGDTRSPAHHACATPPRPRDPTTILSA